ncbi:SDR family NAD(P)-dependent oxidoreductase [Streptomyces sp. F001]|uniref:SDR family NAD(P)-dependent oxidoreductase n=1 Tax=Streptomyces sp. F001 TaxID=1510026 RepID=UPI00101E62FA|nr:SDR family NAD(P)-dependent oxidoreductase [Streptomyces sp. F001]RZB18236.1 SDR family NAD(P)-dependent oxidoreductase [Streptomyces sp. F001]
MAEKTSKTSTWNVTHLPDLTGRTAVVTGANSGIGLTAADALARAGAHVVFAVRDPERGRGAAASVNGSTEVRRLDLADLSSVREFAEAWQGRPLSLLINNAGVMMLPRQRTRDGFEMQFGTNHLGHFALTNLLFTLELQRRLAESGSAVRALAAHPGYAATNLQSHVGNPVMRAFMKFGNRFFAQDDKAGALPTLYAAVQDLPGAGYVGPDGLGEMRGAPTLVGRSAAASDPAAARRLWTVSEELTGVSFPLGAASGVEAGRA